MKKSFIYSEKTDLSDIKNNIRLSIIEIHNLALNISTNKLMEYYGKSTEKKIDFFSITPYFKACIELMKQYDEHQNYKNDSLWQLVQLYKQRSDSFKQEKIDDTLNRLIQLDEDASTKKQKDELKRIAKLMQETLKKYKVLFDKVIKIRNITEQTVKEEEEKREKIIRVFRSIKYSSAKKTCAQCKNGRLFLNPKIEKAELFCDIVYNKLLEDYIIDENTTYYKDGINFKNDIVAQVVHEATVESCSVCKKFKKIRTKSEFVRKIQRIIFKLQLKFGISPKIE